MLDAFTAARGVIIRKERRGRGVRRAPKRGTKGLASAWSRAATCWGRVNSETRRADF